MVALPSSGRITAPRDGKRVEGKNQRFVGNLSAPAKAVIGDSQGVGTIINDEGRNGEGCTAMLPPRRSKAADASAGPTTRRTSLRSQPLLRPLRTVSD